MLSKWIRVIFHPNPSGPLFSTLQDVLAPNLVKSRSREIPCSSVISLWHLTDISAAQLPVKCQSDLKSLNPNSRLRLRDFTRSCGKTSYRGPAELFNRFRIVHTNSKENINGSHYWSEASRKALEMQKVLSWYEFIMRRAWTVGIPCNVAPENRQVHFMNPCYK